jgi:hypothetical protein
MPAALVCHPRRRDSCFRFSSVRFHSRFPSLIIEKNHRRVERLLWLWIHLGCKKMSTVVTFLESLHITFVPRLSKVTTLLFVYIVSTFINLDSQKKKNMHISCRLTLRLLSLVCRNPLLLRLTLALGSGSLCKLTVHPVPFHNICFHPRTHDLQAAIPKPAPVQRSTASARGGCCRRRRRRAAACSAWRRRARTRRRCRWA